MWSSPVTSTPLTAEPIELDAAKEFLRLDDDSFDGQVADLIAGARAEVEAITGTRLVEQSIALRADSFADLARLPIGPVTAATQILYLDVDAEEQLLDGDAFELFGEGLERGIRPVVGAQWPLAASRFGAVKVVMTVGYAELPRDLRVVLLRMIRGLFDDKPVDPTPLLTNHRIWL
jgi:uncharacterized phiE125 gp8 family phage protein